PMFNKRENKVYMSSSSTRASSLTRSVLHREEGKKIDENGQGKWSFKGDNEVDNLLILPKCYFITIVEGRNELAELTEMFKKDMAIVDGRRNDTKDMKLKIEL
ncbi:unnamed protein product, partial [Ilex paraguariensis]